MSTHKLVALAREGKGEQILPGLFETPDDPAGPQPRHVIAVADVTHGLGLDAPMAGRVQRILTGTNVEFTTRGGTQRLASGRGRLAEFMRTQDIDSDVRQEIERRALAYWRKNQKTDLRLAPKLHYMKAGLDGVLARLEKAASHKYLRREPDGRGGWNYIYSGKRGEVPLNEDQHGLLQKKHAEIEALRQRVQELKGKTRESKPPSEKPAPKLTMRRKGEPHITVEKRHDGSDHVVEHASKQEAHRYGMERRQAGAHVFSYSAEFAKKHGLDPRAKQVPQEQPVKKPNLYVVKGETREQVLERLEKAASHKYLTRKPDGKGGWAYTYAVPKSGDSHSSYDEKGKVAELKEGTPLRDGNYNGLSYKRKIEKIEHDEKTGDTHFHVTAAHSKAGKFHADGSPDKTDVFTHHADDSFSHEGRKILTHAQGDKLKPAHGYENAPKKTKSRSAAAKPEGTAAPAKSTEPKFPRKIPKEGIEHPGDPGEGKAWIMGHAGPEKVDAQKFGNYAVHKVTTEHVLDHRSPRYKHPGVDGAPSTETSTHYAVTHLPTGLKLHATGPKLEAQRFAKHMQDHANDVLASAKFGKTDFSKTPTGLREMQEHHKRALEASVYKSDRKLVFAGAFRKA